MEIQTKLLQYQATGPAIRQAIEKWIGPAPSLPKLPQGHEKVTRHTHGLCTFEVPTTLLHGPSFQKQWEEHDPNTKKDITLHAFAGNLDGQPSDEELERYLEKCTNPENISAFGDKFLENDKFSKDLIELASRHLQDRGVLKMLAGCILASNLTFEEQGEGDAPLTESRLHGGQPDGLVCARVKVKLDKRWPKQTSQNIHSLPAQTPSTIVLTLLCILKLGDLISFDDNYKRKDKTNMDIEVLMIQPAVELCRACLRKPDQVSREIIDFLISNKEYLEKMRTPRFDPYDSNCLSGWYIALMILALEWYLDIKLEPGVEVGGAVLVAVLLGIGLFVAVLLVTVSALPVVALLIALWSGPSS